MKKSARVAGALFLVSTGAYMLGSGLLNPVLHRPDFLSNLYTDRTNVMLGWFLEWINAMAVLGIAMLLYPILKRHNEAFALGYFGSRVIESVLLILSAIGPFVLIALSHDYIFMSTAQDPAMEWLGQIVLDLRAVLFQTAMLVLSLGSLLLCHVLYRARLIPRLLSVIGFIGYTALLANSCLAILGYETGSVLYIPGAVFEIAFPVWLLVKGFDVRILKSSTE